MRSSGVIAGIAILFASLLVSFMVSVIEAELS